MQEIALFNKALNVANVNFKSLNQLAIQKGYIVSPDCCNTRVQHWLVLLPNNINTTFYNSWNDVVSKTREEIALDQVIHYLSTYGSDYQDTPYMPNDSPRMINFTDCKVIKSISPQEIEDKIQSMFNSGIALKEETIVMCMNLVEELGLIIKYEEIRNKEVMMHFCKLADIIPTKREEMVRYLLFLYTGSTLLIKDKETIKTIKSIDSVDVTSLINRYGVENLSSVFHRFKPLFLAMKKGSHKPIINKLRKMAVKYHTPLQPGFWENILSDISLLPQVEERLKSLSNFKKISLLQTINVRYKNTGVMPILIRNQKLFVKVRSSETKSYYVILQSMIYKSLIDSLSMKKCKIKLNSLINLALPTSEKSFIGNVPFGSTVELGTSNCVVGINWRQEDGAHDLDLSLTDENQNKIGWNSSYCNNDSSIIYSGDMTSANPEATELLFCKNGVPSGLVKANLYNGNPNSELTLFFAKTNDSYEVKQNHMVDPNDVLFSTRLSMSSQEMMFGIIVNNRFQFANIRTGNGTVSNGTSVTTNYIQYCKSTSDCYLNLITVLKDAGFEIVNDNADIDLSTLDKSSLISLLA